jgi:hypothetical protein
MTTTQDNDTDNAKAQAAAQLASIVEMVGKLNREQESGNDDAYIEAQEDIQNDALSVEVRSGWTPPGDVPFRAEEFMILLCTGGPAVRIFGTLDEHMQPDRARLEYQDWFTPWAPYICPTEAESDALLTYCQQFYFGE